MSKPTPTSEDTKTMLMPWLQQLLLTEIRTPIQDVEIHGAVDLDVVTHGLITVGYRAEYSESIYYTIYKFAYCHVDGLVELQDLPQHLPSVYIPNERNKMHVDPLTPLPQDK